MSHPNVELIEAWATLMRVHDMNIIRRVFAPDADIEDVAMGVKCRGHAQIEQFYGEIFAAFPDFLVITHAMVADANSGGVEFTQTGTHLGIAWGAPPTGRMLNIRGASVMQFAGGRIASQRDYWSLPHYYEQLGLPLPSTLS
jgi:steroid delta-isomerase-like uncharacterized protein